MTYAYTHVIQVYVRGFCCQYTSWLVIDSDLMGFYSDSMGFYSDSMGCYSDLMGS